MTKKDKAGCISLIVRLMTMPMTYYLWIMVLKRVGASDIMWFIFFLSISFNLLLSVLSVLTEYFITDGKKAD
jgi:hypothetical protein